MSSKTIFTLGFQNFTLVDFIRLINEQEVFRVVDIRANDRISHGRKPFSPEQLKSILGNINVDYIRMPEVGMPDKLSDTSSENGHRADFIKRYLEIISTDKSIIKKVKKYFKDDKVLILCIEVDPFVCKRKPFARFVTTILDEKTRIKSLSIKDLKPRVIPPLPPIE